MNAKLVINLREKKLGLLIKDARIAAGKSKKECGEAIGVSAGTMGSIERGLKSPSLPELEFLAFFLGIPIEHFWQDQIRSGKKPLSNNIHIEHSISLRNRSIGELLLKIREEKSVTLKQLSEKTGATTAKLKKFELGTQPIPLPYLEVICQFYDLDINLFFDNNTQIGIWIAQRKSIEEYLKLSPELQLFVSQPSNHPYIEVAKNLSQLSSDKLRQLAEGLLEITL